MKTIKEAYEYYSEATPEKQTELLANYAESLIRSTEDWNNFSQYMVDNDYLLEDK